MRPYRIVADSRDRAAWLAARRQCSVTASEVATVMGLTPWQSAEGLLVLKLSSPGVQQQTDDAISRKAQVFWGRGLEQAAFTTWMRWERMLGFAVWGRWNTRLLVSTERPYLGATPDALVRRDRRLHVMDVKRPGFYSLQRWHKSGVPDYYRAQVACQIYVVGAEAGLLMGQVDAEPLCLTVERCPEYEARMLAAVDSFHETLVREKRRLGQVSA